MHEASVAHSVVQTVLKNARDQHAQKVHSVELEIGELTFLNIEQVIFWIQNGFENTLAQGCELKTASVPVRIQCRNCHFQGSVELKTVPKTHFTVPVLTCQECGNDDVEIIQGKDVVVRNIRIVRSNHKE